MKLDKNLYKKHKRVIKELEINKLFQILGLKWIIVILITTITGNDFLGTIVVLIIIYDFYITIKKKSSNFKKSFVVMLRELKLYNKVKEL